MTRTYNCYFFNYLRSHSSSIQKNRSLFSFREPLAKAHLDEPGHGVTHYNRSKAARHVEEIAGGGGDDEYALAEIV